MTRLPIVDFKTMEKLLLRLGNTYKYLKMIGITEI
jgi:hypothetical protein